ncbi:TIGR02206 family membrane protein [Paenibacillus sp. sgz500958]|uniref:YwaF family protein n=1 Tax=Paenibacillus sp. sgz500958 TaxID=3242475 RepID=UPI0036D25E08
MNGFMSFDRQHETDFVMFSMTHWISLLLIIALSLLLYRYRLAIRVKPRLKLVLRVVLIIILLSCEASLQAWYLTHDLWKTAISLPLELCGISLMLSVIMLVTRTRRLYSFLFFAGIGGASIALLTPNLVYPFPHFRFLLFFIVHAAIIWASLYMTWIEGFKPTWKSLWFTVIWLNVVAAVVWTFNHFLGANYMFLNRKPSTYSILNSFGPYPYYLLVEELFALGLFMLMYLLFFRLPERMSS